jgi:Dihydrodipicolinate synthetase family
MSRHSAFVPQGVIPAVLLPFHEDLSIDEPSFRAHLRDVGAVQGLSAITINAHSTEVASCTQDEQLRVMEITGEEVGDTLPIIHGVWADGSLEAARISAGSGRRGVGAASIPAGSLHTRPVGRDGADPFQDDRRCDRSATDRFSISFGHRAGLSGGDAGAAFRRSADHPRNQGLDATGAAA